MEKHATLDLRVVSSSPTLGGHGAYLKLKIEKQEKTREKRPPSNQLHKPNNKSYPRVVKAIGHNKINSMSSAASCLD